MTAPNKVVSTSWADSASLCLYPYTKSKSTLKDAISNANSITHSSQSTATDIVHITTTFIFEVPVLRGLLAEANSLFHELQERSALSNLTQTDFLKISNAYRGIIRRCLQKLNCEAENETDENAKGLILNYITVFYSIECIWHLCEIFVIQTASSNLVIPQLIEWIRFHFPAAEQRATELVLNINDDSGDWDNTEYLSVVKALIIQGYLDVARTILKKYGRINCNATFQMVDDILRTLPIYDITSGLSEQSWRSQWQYWVTDAEAKIQMGCFESQPELQEIVMLVTGNDAAWTKLIHESSCWYEHLPGFLYYTQPNCTHSQLGAYAENWLRRWMYAVGEEQVGEVFYTSLKHLDRVILMVMQNDFHQILFDIQSMCDQQWFATHLTDLLWHCGKLSILSKDQSTASSALRDSLLLDFGSLLMSKDVFWEFGLGYLEQCANEDINAIEILLPKVVIRNEKQALKVANIAKNRNLLDVEKEICRIQAIKSFKNERYGNALDWALRSQDTNTVSMIIDFFLKHYVTTGNMLCHDVISKAGAKMFISPRLVFLAKYFDFQSFFRNDQYPQAAELLVNLLDSKIAPGYFLNTLFSDAFALLEMSDPIFSTKDTYRIIHYLETQLTILLERQDEMANKTTEQDDLHSVESTWKLVKSVRTACARNLSRAIAIEHTVI